MRPNAADGPDSVERGGEGGAASCTRNVGRALVIDAMNASPEGACAYASAPALGARGAAAALSLEATFSRLAVSGWGRRTLNEQGAATWACGAGAWGATGAPPGSQQADGHCAVWCAPGLGMRAGAVAYAGSVRGRARSSAAGRGLSWTLVPRPRCAIVLEKRGLQGWRSQQNKKKVADRR